LQVFLEGGNLFPGIHEYSLEDFEKQFINDFTTSETRKPLFHKFCRWLNELLEVLPPRYIWLDGSYLTIKTNPNDIDLVVFYRPEDIPNDEVAKKLMHLINVASRENSLDAYLSLIFDHLHPNQLANFDSQSKIMKTYWMGQFGFDRQQKPKGIIEFSQEEFQKIGGVTHDVSSRTN
jgi:hypothetical protein